MGQRHQFYVKLPFEVNEYRTSFVMDDETGLYKKETKNFKGNIVALHHQWLFGTLPLKSLERLLTFHKNSIDNEYEFTTFKKSYGDTDDIVTILNADVENGNTDTFSLLEMDDINPLKAENNDGITIVDLSKEQPRYAFMFLNDINKPLSAEQYVRSYYDDTDYKRFVEQGIMDSENVLKWEHNILENVLPFYDDKEMLTIDEIKEMLSSMYEQKDVVNE